MNFYLRSYLINSTWLFLCMIIWVLYPANLYGGIPADESLLASDGLFACDSVGTVNLKVDQEMLNLQTVQQLLDKGEQEMALNNFQVAVAYFDKGRAMCELMKDTGTSIAFHKLHVNSYYLSGYCWTRMANYSEGLRLLFETLKLVKEDEIFIQAQIYSTLGSIYFYRNNFKIAERYFRRSLMINHKEKIKLGLLHDNISLASLFGSRNLPDSALIYLLDAHKLALDLGTKEDEIAVLQNIGLVYKDLGKPYLAEGYLLDALKITQRFGNQYLESAVYLNLGGLSISQGDINSAETFGKKALLIAEDVHADLWKIKALDLLANIFKEKKLYKKAYDFAILSHHLQDSLFSAESEQKILELQSNFDAYQFRREREILKKDLMLTRAKVEKRNLLLALVGVGLLLIILGSGLFIRRYLAQRRLNRLLNQKIYQWNERAASKEAENIRVLDEKLAQQSRELTTKTLFMVRVDEIASELISKIRLLTIRMSPKGKNALLLREVENMASQITIDNSWDEFNVCFEQVDHAFYERLSERLPELTLGEKRLCALMRLNLTTKEIARITNRSPRSVETARFRLRKKINLEAEDNLYSFFAAM